MTYLRLSEYFVAEIQVYEIFLKLNGKTKDEYQKLPTS